MDDHTDAHVSPDTSSGTYLKLVGPPICILLAGLTITAFAGLQSATISWVYGSVISGFGAFICALVTFRHHRQTKVLATVRKELQHHLRQINNMQAEKRILRQALNESEQRSRDLVSLSGAIICELDEERKAGYVSAGVTDVLGHVPEEVAGVDVISLISENDHDAFNSTLTTARQSRELQRTDLSLVNADGEPVGVTLRVLALHDTLHGFNGFRLSMQPLPRQP